MFIILLTLLLNEIGLNFSAYVCIDLREVLKCLARKSDQKSDFPYFTIHPSIFKFSRYTGTYFQCYTYVSLVILKDIKILLKPTFLNML